MRPAGSSTGRREAGGKVTRERMQAYRSMREEIRELQYRLRCLEKNGDTGRHAALRDLYTARICSLEQDCAEVEAVVEAVPNSLTRRIFRMYFLDSMSQAKVARKVHLSQSSVSKKIAAYFKME